MPSFRPTAQQDPHLARWPPLAYGSGLTPSRRMAQEVPKDSQLVRSASPRVLEQTFSGRRSESSRSEVIPLSENRFQTKAALQQDCSAAARSPPCAIRAPCHSSGPHFWAPSAIEKPRIYEAFSTAQHRLAPTGTAFDSRWRSVCHEGRPRRALRTECAAGQSPSCALGRRHLVSGRLCRNALTPALSSARSQPPQ